MPLRGRPAARGTPHGELGMPHTLRDYSFTEDAMPEAAEAMLPVLLSTLLTFSTPTHFSDAAHASGPATPGNSWRKDRPRCGSR